MNVLALDLGTRMGWAIIRPNGTISGMKSFVPRSHDVPGQRWINFRAFLNELAAMSETDIGAIYFEDLIMNAKHGVGPIVMFGGYVAHLQLWAGVRRIPLYPVHNATIKKHWTGKGNAKKVDMLRVCRERGIHAKDDNEADALALLDYALCCEGAATPTAIEQAPLASVDFDDPFARPIRAAA